MPTPSIQSNSASGVFTCAFVSNNTAGNTIVVFFTGSAPSDPTATSSCTDSNGNTYTRVASGYVGFSQSWASLWVATGIASGANTITCANSAAGFTASPIVFIAEEPATTGVRVSNGNSFNFGTASAPTVSLAGTTASDVVVGGFLAAFSVVITNGNVGSNAAFMLQNRTQVITEDGLSSGGTINVTAPGSTTQPQEWLALATALIGTPPPTLPSLVPPDVPARGGPPPILRPVNESTPWDATVPPGIRAFVDNWQAPPSPGNPYVHAKVASNAADPLDATMAFVPTSTWGVGFDDKPPRGNPKIARAYNDPAPLRQVFLRKFIQEWHESPKRGRYVLRRPVNEDTPFKAAAPPGIKAWVPEWDAPSRSASRQISRAFDNVGPFAAAAVVALATFLAIDPQAVASPSRGNQPVNDFVGSPLATTTALATFLPADDAARRAQADPAPQFQTDAPGQLVFGRSIDWGNDPSRSAIQTRAPVNDPVLDQGVLGPSLWVSWDEKPARGASPSARAVDTGVPQALSFGHAVDWGNDPSRAATSARRPNNDHPLDALTPPLPAAWEQWDNLPARGLALSRRPVNETTPWDPSLPITTPTNWQQWDNVPARGPSLSRQPVNEALLFDFQVPPKPTAWVAAWDAIPARGLAAGSRAPVNETITASASTPKPWLDFDAPLRRPARARAPTQDTTPLDPAIAPPSAWLGADDAPRRRPSSGRAADNDAPPRPLATVGRSVDWGNDPVRRSPRASRPVDSAPVGARIAGPVLSTWAEWDAPPPRRAPFFVRIRGASELLGIAAPPSTPGLHLVIGVAPLVDLRVVVAPVATIAVAVVPTTTIAIAISPAVVITIEIE